MAFTAAFPKLFRPDSLTAFPLNFHRGPSQVWGLLPPPLQASCHRSPAHEWKWEWEWEWERKWEWEWEWEWE